MGVVRAIVGPMSFEEAITEMERHFSFLVEMKVSSMAEIRRMQEGDQWCEERWGKNGLTQSIYDDFEKTMSSSLNLNAKWASYNQHYYFSDENHAVEFKFRWG